MEKRLIEINPETMYPMEIDEARLRHETGELKQFLLALGGTGWQELQARIIPFCDDILNNKLPLPLDSRKRPIHLTRLDEEGLSVPIGFEERYVAVLNTATGVRVDLSRIVHRDGKIFGWMEFE